MSNKKERQLFTNANFIIALRNLEIVLNLEIADGLKKKEKEKSHC